MALAAIKLGGGVVECHEFLTIVHISANLSTQWDTSVIGGRAGGGARPGTWGAVSLIVSSDISMNSSSNSFLTTFGGREAAGL